VLWRVVFNLFLLSEPHNFIIRLLFPFNSFFILILFLVLYIIRMYSYPIFKRIRIYLTIIMQILTIGYANDVMEISLRTFQVNLFLSILTMPLFELISTDIYIMLNFISNAIDRRSSFNNLIKSLSVSGNNELINRMNSPIQTSSITLIINIDIYE